MSEKSQRCPAALLAVILAFVASNGWTANFELNVLQDQLSRTTDKFDGAVGISVRHLETGQALDINGSMSFPTGSTFKVPVAVHVLSLIDEGRLSLDDTVTLSPHDVYPNTYGPISHFLHPGSALTVRDLLSLMLMTSDNNATDILLRLTGGSSAASERMRALNFNGLHVGRPTWVAIAAYFTGDAAVDLDENRPISPERFGALTSRTLPNSLAEERAREYDNDLRNGATPSDMARLLAKVWRREILSAESTEIMLRDMYGCITGADRIKGALPEGTPVAHKTGTGGGSLNDVGIVDLPGGAGHVVIAIFTTRSYRPEEEREAVVAELARSVYDFFVFSSQESAEPETK